MIRYLIVLCLGYTFLLFSPYSFADEGRVLSTQELAMLESGEVISEIWREKSRQDNALEAYAAIYIKASPAQVWAVMRSCEASTQIVKDMVSCNILQAGPNEAWDIREQRFRAPFPLGRFRTVFRTDFTPYHKMTIRRTAGDMKTQDAIWAIDSVDNSYTRVTYRASLALKIPVPRFMMRRALRKDTPELMINLRRFVEAEAAKGANKAQVEDENARKEAGS